MSQFNRQSGFRLGSIGGRLGGNRYGNSLLDNNQGGGGAFPKFGTRPRFLDQFGQALVSEAEAQKGAIDRQREREMGQVDRMEELTGSIGGRVGDATMDQFGALGGTADLLEVESANDMARTRDLTARAGTAAEGLFDEAANQFRSSVQGAGRIRDLNEDYQKSFETDLQAGFQKFDLAASQAMKAAGGFRKQALQGLAETARGIVGSVRDQLRMMSVNADGTMKSPAEVAAAEQEIIGRTNEMVATQIGQLRLGVEQTFAQLKQAAAGFTQQAGAARLQGAEQRTRAAGQAAANEAQASQIEQAAGAGLAQVGEARSREAQSRAGTDMQGQQLRQQALQTSAAIRQFMGQLSQSGVLSSIQLELQGRTSIAQYIQDNPEEIVSILSGLLAMGQIGTSPGGGGLAGFSGLDALMEINR